MKNRFKIVAVVMLLVSSILLLRVFDISVISHDFYQNKAIRNSHRIENEIPTRGTIKDINQKPLAINQLGFSISLAPNLFYESNASTLNKAIDLISSQLDMNKTKLKRNYISQASAYNHAFIKVVDFEPYEKLIYKLPSLYMNKNIRVVPAYRRYYPQKEIASHVVGYVLSADQSDIKNNDITKLIGIAGKSGIEKKYNDILQGIPGKKTLLVNSLNKTVDIQNEEAPISKDITLTIDVRLQKYINTLFKNKRGVVLVMNVNDGAILSAGSYLEYDLNMFSNSINEKKWDKLVEANAFNNKLVSGLYPPGSLIKPAVGFSFLTSNKIKADNLVYCEGKIKVGDRYFRDWKTNGHGYMNLKSAIKESCDVYFYKNSLKVGIDHISQEMGRFGFGKLTNIDLPNEFSGNVPTRQWKSDQFNTSWYLGDTLNTSIGQGGFLVTPIQLAKYISIIAKGHVVTPHFLYKVGDEKIIFNIEDPNFSSLEKRYLALIREGMREAVASPKGTAHNKTTTKVKIAGKTGTSQVIEKPQGEKELEQYNTNLSYENRPHGLFGAFAPYDNPKYVVVVIVEHSGSSGIAVSIASNIFDKLEKLEYIKS